MSKKELLSRVLYHSGLLRVAAAFASGTITVLTYHRLRPDETSGPHAFDEEVFGPAQSCFEQQMKWLQRNMTVLSESDVLELMTRNHRSGKDHYVVVTFDDGYKDNYDLAYPVLRSLSIPAIFFVCPRLLDERRLGWWDVIAYLVKQSTRPQIEILGETLRFGQNKAASIRKLHTWMKSLPGEQTVGLLDTLSEAAGVPFPSTEMQGEQLMTWEQVAEVSDNGVAIGSHTHTHRVLATLEEEEQRWELRESKAALERRLGRKVRTLAYPAGRHGNFTLVSMRLARECGYQGAFSFHSGGNLLRSVTRFDIHRISVADELSPMFTCAAMFPDMFTWRHSRG